MKISFTLNITRKMVFALVVVAVIGTAAATMTLFTHTFPVVKTVPPTPILTTGCATLSNETAAPLQGSSGNVTFGCPSSVAGAAFIASSSGGIATPTFSLGTGYTNLYIWQALQGVIINNDPQCMGTKVLQLQSGVSTTFPSPGVPTYYIYCAQFTSAPSVSFGTFTVTWTQ